MKNEAIQRRLLTESDITLEEVYKKATAMESAERELIDINKPREGIFHNTLSAATTKTYINRGSGKNQQNTRETKMCWKCS